MKIKPNIPFWGVRYTPPMVWYQISAVYNMISVITVQCSSNSKMCQWAISELPCASVSKRVLSQKLSRGKEYDLHENESAGGTQFNINGSHEDSFWHRGKSQLGNSQFTQTGSGKPLQIKFLFPESLNKIQLHSLIRLLNAYKLTKNKSISSFFPLFATNSVTHEV